MTRQMTFRIPDEVGEFVKNRAADLQESSTAVVIAALQAEMRRCEIERERAILVDTGSDPYPDLPSQDASDVAEVWKDLDW